MKYYLDTEFIEGTQKRFFGTTKPTIDLISIGIVAEDGREYYAICKDFNLNDAWNRYDLDHGHGDQRNLPPRKVYWIRENVLYPIYVEMVCRKFGWLYEQLVKVPGGIHSLERSNFTLEMMHYYIPKYGKSQRQIADEVIAFCNNGEWADPEFYGYYSAYDWVGFCWIFGKMINRPKGFPIFCIDLKQMLDEKVSRLSNSDFFTKFHIEKQMTLQEKLKEIKKHTQYPTQDNAHNALDDARWNKRLHEFILTL